MAKHIQVDIIGACGDGGSLANEEDYKFYLAFENHNCVDYITEKFFLVLHNRHTVPVVMGASKDAYDLFGPKGSYIHVDDFSGPADLGE